MEREEILNKIQQCLDFMDKWDINTYRSGSRDMNALNPAFGYRNTDNTTNLSRVRGVMSIWMRNGAKDMTVHTMPRGYSGSDRDFKTRDLNDKQLSAILSMVQNVCKRELDKLKQAAMNPDLKDMVPHIQAWSKKCAAAVSPKHSSFVSLGKRAYETQKYHAILILEENDQIASISLKQDSSGKIWYNERTPLGGELAHDLELPVKSMFQSIKESFESLTNTTFSLDDRQEREKLTEFLKNKIRQWQESGMNHTLNINGKEQNFRIGFEQDFSRTDSVGIKLTATPLGTTDYRTMALAEGRVSFNRKNPFGWLEMEAKGDAVDILEAMANKELVDEIELYKIPGREKRMTVDAHGLYESYLQQMNRSHYLSLLSGITVTSTTDGLNGGKTVHTLEAQLAGITTLRGAVNDEQASLLKKIADKPQYTYLEQQIARQTLGNQLEKYEEMKERISDIQITRQANGDYIRCRIDGVQQLRQPLFEGQFKQYDNAVDKETAKTLLAMSAYSDELKPSQNQGMKR